MHGGVEADGLDVGIGGQRLEVVGGDVGAGGADGGEAAADLIAVALHLGGDGGVGDGESDHAVAGAERGQRRAGGAKAKAKNKKWIEKHVGEGARKRDRQVIYEVKVGKLTVKIIEDGNGDLDHEVYEGDVQVLDF